MNVTLTDEEKDELQEIFNLVDTDRGGSISKEELKTLMDTLGIQASQEEIDLMITEIDENNDGEIQFDEFVAVMSRKVNGSYTSDDVKSAFRVFEDGKPGYVSIDKIEKALSNYGSSKMENEKATQLVSQIETDKTGYFNYREYVELMMPEK